MATVRPFRGVTYDPTQVDDVGAVTCPPYDVISPADREELYARHPYNIVRIVSGRDEEEDGDEENKYTRACGFFRSWLWEGVLREDHEPALYVYRQAFTDPSGHFRRVWGLLGAISLDDEILAHERTMSEPKADRLALMEEVPANLSPIYALYREPGGGVSAALQDQTTDPPVAEFVDDEETRHTVWAVHDPAFHDKVADALAGSPLFIADGHHRFETAKLYRDRRREADGPGAWDSIMTLLVDAGAQPVCILPYHRIVRRCGVEDPLGALEGRFDIESLGPATPERCDEWGLELWDEEREGAFVAVVGSEGYRLIARDAPDAQVPAGVLERLALDPLGVTGAEGYLSFTPRAAEVGREVTSGGAACGFLIRPVSVDRVWELSAAGGRMPEKSTYFHPKPRDGIVIRPVEPCGPDAG